MQIRHQYALRDVGVKGRTLTLACVPFDRPTWIEDDDGQYQEVFRRGAFAHVHAPKVQLRLQHSTDLLDRLGSAVSLREEPTQLVGDFRVIDDKAGRGDHLLALVDADELRGVSIGFVPDPSHQTVTRAPEGHTIVERTRVKTLLEVSLVDEPAYAEAQVLAHRKAAVDQATAQWRADVAARVAAQRRARGLQWVL